MIWLILLHNCLLFMIESIKIQNYKSIVNLTMTLGRFNVIIGPNGCGKTNILEAISLAGAASQDKLDNEYLANRDLRVTDSQFMINAFEEDEDSRREEGMKRVIGIEVTISGMPFIFNLEYEDSLKRWVNFSSSQIFRRMYAASQSPAESGESMQKLMGELAVALSKSNIDMASFTRTLQSLSSDSAELSSFLTYRPSEHFLRKTFDSTLFPLGVHGEGLLKYLKEAADKDGRELFSEVNEGLMLLDWFDGFNIPDNLMQNEYRLSIGDRYLRDSLHYFDQRSTNEGFLFLLFYLTLFNSQDTPQFFAIDNIETAMNPKLVTKLTKYLVERSRAKGKQVIVTTHCPYVLDGLDLSDDEIRLFVARRDIDGHSRLERIPYRHERKMELSQLWLSGLIGGLPDNF